MLWNLDTSHSVSSIDRAYPTINLLQPALEDRFGFGQLEYAASLTCSTRLTPSLLSTTQRRELLESGCDASPISVLHQMIPAKEHRPADNKLHLHSSAQPAGVEQSAHPVSQTAPDVKSSPKQLTSSSSVESVMSDPEAEDEELDNHKQLSRHRCMGRFWRQDADDSVWTRNSTAYKRDSVYVNSTACLSVHILSLFLYFFPFIVCIKLRRLTLFFSLIRAFLRQAVRFVL